MKGISGKDGRWEGRYTAGYDSKTGKRVVKSVLGKTQAAVKEKLKPAIETHTIPRIRDIKLKTLTSRHLQKLYKDLSENRRVNWKSGKGNPGLSSTTVAVSI